MYILYLIALTIVGIWGILWIARKEISWPEALIPAAFALIVAGTFHGCLVYGMTSDKETWSGYTTAVTYHPPWVQWYMQSHTQCTGSGKNQICHTYYTRETRHIPEYWGADLWFGTKGWEQHINPQFFNELKAKFGGGVDVVNAGHFDHDSGDQNMYVTKNATGWIQPVNYPYGFTNRVKAAPSTFSYAKVPKTIKVFEYPNNDLWSSNRILGTATATFGTLAWDQLNSRLGPTKFVNLIVIGFPAGSDSQMSQYQEAAWVGGKKNDLVLTYALGNDGKVAWARVFGWTEKEMVKRKLEQILLQDVPSEKMIPAIEEEVKANYKIKDWSKFDYITIEPPMWSIITMLIILVTASGTMGFFAFKQDIFSIEGGRFNRKNPVDAWIDGDHKNR